MTTVKSICPSKPWLLSPGHLFSAQIPLLSSDPPVICLLENSTLLVQNGVNYFLHQIHSSSPAPTQLPKAETWGTPSLPSFPLTHNSWQNCCNSTRLPLFSRSTATTSVQATFMSHLLYGNNLLAGPSPQPLSAFLIQFPH